MVEEKQEGGVFCHPPPGKIGLNYKILKYNNPYFKTKYVKSKQNVKELGKFIMQSINGMLVANQCNHQVFLTEQA